MSAHEIRDTVIEEHAHRKIRRTAKPDRNGQQKWKEIEFIVCVKVDLNHFTMYLAKHRVLLKGILHQKIFYRLNLIFWIVMGCGIARFGRRGLKTTET